MNPLANIAERLRDFNLERFVGLKPPYPPVVLEVNRESVVLVRLKRRRGGRPLLEVHQEHPVPEAAMPASFFESPAPPSEEFPRLLKSLFERSGTRPGRVSMVVPDNLAKITLLRLPERPASRRQLEEIVHGKMRRAVPFRLEDAAISYQVLPAEGRQVSILVVLLRAALVHRAERALESLGARPGLVDICTPNLFNLCRPALAKASRGEGDAALLNCARNYFSLLIVRNERLIFFRCKTFAAGDEISPGPNGVLTREIASSFSYYREKLEGQGVRTMFIRSVAATTEEIAEKVRGLGCENVEVIDPLGSVALEEGVRIDQQLAQRLAPAIGAATARGN